MTASERIVAEVGAWPGVATVSGSRAEWSFCVGRRELGHLHGDHVAHFAFPEDVWTALHAAGRIGYHPAFPGRPGWGARRIESDEDIEDIVALLRLNYERRLTPA